MREPKLLKDNQVIAEKYGKFNFLLHKLGLIKIPETKINDALVEHKQKVWVQWTDWRWGNATMMAGSYTKMHIEHKKTVMDRCYAMGIEFGVDIDYISKFLNKNSFGWETPQNKISAV